eukprot:5922749-Pyramimonas_sp.AAC.1
MHQGPGHESLSLPQQEMFDAGLTAVPHGKTVKVYQSILSGKFDELDVSEDLPPDVDQPALQAVRTRAPWMMTERSPLYATLVLRQSCVSSDRLMSGPIPHPCHPLSCL